jgi:hypothetical protein
MISRLVTGRDVFAGTPVNAAAERADLLSRIARLEASQARPLREAAIGDTEATKRLHDINAAIAQARTKLRALT